MKRKGWKLACLLCALLLLSGCQLALEDGGNQEKDRLIGVFLTWDYLDLFDHDAFLQDHMDDIMKGNAVQSDGSSYQGRLYAVQKENGDFVFENVAGMNFFIPTWVDEMGNSYTGICADPGISESHQHIHVTDEGEKYTISGTVYVAPSGGDRVLYENPVYQTEDGRVYTVQGTGMGFASMAGGFSVKTEETTTTTDEKGNTVTNSMVMEITVEGMEAVGQYTVLQMDAAHHVTATLTFQPSDAPEEILPDPGCAYIVLQAQQAEGNAYTLYQPADEYMRVYALREDSVMEAQDIPIRWVE